MSVFDEYEFALCLTHDLDRPYKTYQSLYHAIHDRRLNHIIDTFHSQNSYWQIDDITALEDELGVRSAFYILNEPHILEKDLRTWLCPRDWAEHFGRYDVRDSKIVEALCRLVDGGWEVGLHGSYRSCDDVDRLGEEKALLEELIDTPVSGGRQHHLNLDVLETWRHHADIGLRYDTSLGSNETFGFQYGYQPLRPFDDEFVVFPLTLMEQTLPNPETRFDEAWADCLGLLEEAAANGAVMTVLWHPRLFSESDFPGYRGLYRRLIERALEMGAWVGSPADCYREFDLERPHPERHGTVGSERTSTGNHNDIGREKLQL